MEESKMADMNMNKLDDSVLEQVTGGERRRVDTGTSQNAVVRRGPGRKYGQIDSLENDTPVNATGRFKVADGRRWAEIDYPVEGWIAASIIGYSR
jgi:hypothetical protein